MSTTTTPEARNPAVKQIGEAVLVRVPEIVARLLRTVQDDDPGGYGAVPFDEMRPLVEAGVGFLVTKALIEQHRPTPDDLDWLAGALRARARLGVSGESLLASLPTSLHEIWNACATAAGNVRGGKQALEQVGVMLTTWWSIGARLATNVFQSIESENAPADARRKTEFLRSLMTGAATPGEIEAYGLDGAAAYLAFAARAEAAARANLERSLAHAAAVHGVIGRDVVGVLQSRPALEGIDAVVGVGGAAPLNELEEPFTRATRALETAWAFGMRGVFDLGDLGTLPAILSEPEIGRSLHDRYLKPLHGRGDVGEVLIDSLRVFFENDLSVDVAAAKLVVHSNTLRHRLRRFEKITGANLRSQSQLEEIRWALRWHVVSRGEHRGIAP